MKVTLIDFKNHVRTEVEFTGSTQISGRNGSGKTSVLEAILYAYYGRTFFGNIAGENFVRRGRPGCTVLVEGKDVIKRSWGSEGHVFINGKRMRQLDVAAQFPPQELAYALVNPLYMMYELRPFDIRKMFMQYMEMPSREELFKERYGNDEELLKTFRETDWESAKRTKKSLEESIRSLDREIELANIEVLSAKAQREEIAAKRIKMPKGVLLKETKRQAEIQKLEQKLFEIKDSGLRLKELEDWTRVTNERIEKHLKELRVKNLSELIDAYAQSLSTYRVEFNRVSGRLDMQNELLVNLAKLEGMALCPLCGSSLDNLGGLFERTTQERDRLKSHLEEVKPQMEATAVLLEDFKQIREKAVESKEEMSLMKKRVRRVQNLKDRIAKLKDLQKGLTEKDFNNAVESKAQAKMLEAIKTKIYYFKGRVEELKKSKRGLEVQLKTAVLIEEALSPAGVEAQQAVYMGEVLEGELEKFFDKPVEVVTVRRNKSNHNFREVFDVKVGGTSIPELSYGERILLMVVFSVILRKYIKDFRFDFMLLDEASVLSEDNMRKVLEYVQGAGLYLIYTRASDSGLTFETIKNDTN